jgi:hypothetical protein
MAFANKIKLGSRIIGWNVFFSHLEAEAIATNQLSIPAVLKGVTGPRVAPILMTIPRHSWRVTCTAGSHDGVKAIVMFYPPSAILIPR